MQKNWKKEAQISYFHFAVSTKCLGKSVFSLKLSFFVCMLSSLSGVFGDSDAWLNHTACRSGSSEHSHQIKPVDHQCQTAHSLKSYLFIRERVDVLMVRAEQHVPQNWVRFAHHHILIQQCRLGNGVHQDLKETEDRHLKILFGLAAIWHLEGRKVGL